MKPFSISDSCALLVDAYPAANILKTVATTLNSAEKDGFLRLWITEGIPFAFCRAPMLYEAVRGWLAERLGVHAKDVTLIGSGRIGYSLAPYPHYGRLFGEHSDLDFSVISKTLFSELAGDFRRWERDVSDGSGQPKNQREQKYWKENLKLLPHNIRSGFVDSYKIPNRYFTTQKISQALYLLKKKLDATQGAPTVGKLSLRTYRDWPAFLAQMGLNFRLMLQSFDGSPS